MEKLAFFDLDHTVLPQDTQAAFAQYVFEREPWRRIYLLWFTPCLLFAALKIFDLRKMKQIFFSYLAGMPKEKLETYARDFATQTVPAISYPSVVAEIERLRAEGYQLILNSASPEWYVRHIAEHFGFDKYQGTDMQLGARMPWIPKISGPNNKQAAKVRTMKERGWLPENFDPESGETIPDSWAFSDSSADIPMLSIAEHGVVIHPGEKLAATAEKKGWSTILPDRPYEGKSGAKLATIRLALGMGKRFLRK